MHDVVEKNLDIDDALYHIPAGPILVRDVFYGWHVEIAQSGNDYYAHKTGFTSKSLAASLQRAGFSYGALCRPLSEYEVRAIGFRQAPSDAQAKLLGLPDIVKR